MTLEAVPQGDESANTPIEAPAPNFTRLGNQLQLLLAQRSGMELGAWIDEHATDFRAQFEKIENKQELLDALSSKDKLEEVLARFEKTLTEPLRRAA